MKVKYFPESVYLELYDAVPNNISNYESKDDEWIKKKLQNKASTKESRIDVNLPVISVENDEYANAILIHQAFKDKITPKQASNPFLWSYLTHCEYWKYTTDRWAKTGISVDTIRQRFFCGPEEGNRIGFLRNSISRLWWAGYMTYLGDDSKGNPYELTKVLFSHSDICQSVIERNFSMNREITIGILSAIKDINDDPMLYNVGLSKITGEYEWRGLCKYINRYGAVTLLDVLDRNTVHDLAYDFIISNRQENA